MKPQGKLTIIDVKLRQKGKVAIYANIFLEDEKGEVFILHASSFLFDLQEAPD